MKQGIHIHVLAVGKGFHCRKAVAPLKQGIHIHVLAVGKGFPLPKGGGPIEAGQMEMSITEPTQVSTAERRWPH